MRPSNTNWRFVSIPKIVNEYVNAVKIVTPTTTPEITTAEQRQTAFTDMMKIALDAAIAD